MNLKGKNFLKMLDFTPEEIEGMIDLAADLKAKKKAGIAHDTLRGKNIALIFEKTSTRTRCSFEVAAYDLGMGVTYLDPSGAQISKKESIADTARVLGRLYDGINAYDESAGNGHKHKLSVHNQFLHFVVVEDFGIQYNEGNHRQHKEQEGFHHG